MDAKLVVVGGKASKGEVKLKLPTVLGRSRDAGLAIAHPNVSRRHCEIREVEGALVVRDLGSSNGTLVNDEVIKEVVLKPGDMLTVGPLVFRAEYKHAGKFPILGKKDSKAAAADTLEFAPEEIAPEAAKPAVDKTLAKERKATAPPPAPESKKPPAPEAKKPPTPEAKKPPAPEAKKSKPAKEDVETVAPGKLEKVSKPKEKPSDLDDLSLPELDDAMPDLEEWPTAKTDKKAKVDEPVDLPPIEEPAAAVWSEIEPAARQEEQEEADVDLALPSEESESLPELSDDLDLPLPEEETPAEEPGLERPEGPPLEAPAAESMESWGEAEAADDLAPPSEEVENLPELSDDLDLPLPEEESLAEEPELESPGIPPLEAPAAESLESWEEVEPEDDLALGDEVPPLEDVEAGVEEPAARVAATEPPVEEPSEEVEPALDEDAAEVHDEPVAAMPSAGAEDRLDELEELGVADDLPPVAEAALEVPMPNTLEPDPAWIEEAAVEEAEFPAEPAEVDDLPEMTLEEPEEIQEVAAVEEQEIEDEIGELGPLEELQVPKALEPDPAWLEEPTPAEAELDAESAGLDDLPEMTLEEVEEVQEFAAAEESDSTLEESQETKDFLAVEESAFDELDEAPPAELPPVADLEPTIDALPEAEETLAAEGFDDLEPEPLIPAASVETPAPTVDEESELDWLDGGSPEPAVAQGIDDAAIDDADEPSLEESGLENPEVEETPAARSDLPTATHEFTSVERSDATEEDLSLEPAESAPTNEADEEPLEIAEAPPELPEMAAEVSNDKLAEESLAETAEEEAEAEIAAELPPAVPWQTEPEETVAWSPAQGESPPFSLQPEAERPAFSAGATVRAGSAKPPEPSKRKKGWSLFGWLKKKEKPTKTSSPAAPASPATSGPAPTAPLPIPTTIPEPSFEEAEASAWTSESLPEEPPAAESGPPIPEFEPQAALDLPEVEAAQPEIADLEPESGLPQEMDLADLSPAGDEPQLDHADLDESEFAPVEPPLSDMDESSEDIDVGPPIADLEEVGDIPEWKAESAEAVTPPLESLAEDLAPPEPLEMESDDEGLRPVETFDDAEAFDEELPDDVAPPQLPPAAEQAQPHDLPPTEPMISDQSPPAAPAWQVEHEETVAWSPSTEDSPGFTLQPEANRPARYSEAEARAARLEKPAPAPAKKKGWSLFGLLKKKEKPTKASAAPPVEPPAAPQFSGPSPAPESEPAFEEAAFSLPFPESMPDEEPVAEFAAGFAEEPEADELEELEPIADLPEWEPEPDELPEEAPSLEPVAEELPPPETELDDLPPLEAVEELPEEEQVEEFSEEAPPLGPPPVPHAAESHSEQDVEQDATLQWSGDVAQSAKEPKAAEMPPAVPPSKPSVEPPDDITPPAGPASVEPPAAEDLPEFMRAKPTPKTVSGEDDDLNKFFHELGLK